MCLIAWERKRQISDPHKLWGVGGKKGAPQMDQLDQVGPPNQKNPRVRNVSARNSGAGNGPANFMGA